jgi:hypothetical protein
MAGQAFADLITLFNIRQAREAKAHCRKLVIKSEEFADVILAARVVGIGPYSYASRFADIAPEHLEPSREELHALGRSCAGTTVAGKALKAIRKMDQIFEDRHLLAAHLLYSGARGPWHLFYFDQRDYSADENHWEHGPPHIHYSRDSFTSEPLDEVWRKLCQAAPEFPKSIHVHYDYHHNRRRVKATRPSRPNF